MAQLSDPPAAPVLGGPSFSRQGLVAGLIAMLPMVVSQTAFGMVFGMLAAQKAFTHVEAIAMSGIMFAGLAQVVTLQSWPQEMTWAALVALTVATFTVNLRYFLMSLTYRPWLGPLPAWQSYPMLLLMTDPGWLQSMRYHEAGGKDAGFVLGGGLLVFPIWVLSTWLGYEFSAWLTDPKRFGVDLVIPVFFAALLIPAWRGPRRAVPWIVAGLVAVTVQRLGFDYWYIVAGALTGAATAGLMRNG